MKTKWCWVARQIGHGDKFRLKLSIGDKDYPVRDVLLTMNDIHKVTGTKDKIVFIHQE